MKSDWTAYYAPAEECQHKSGFATEEDAKTYALSRKDLDEDAWFFIETHIFERCQNFDDISAAAGYVPSEGSIKTPRIECDSPRWIEYAERCQRIGIEPIRKL